MTKIDRVEELPDWFSIDHYSSVSRFGAIEWYKQLEQRSRLLSLLEKSRAKPPYLAEEYNSAFLRCIKYTRGVAVEHADIPNFFGDDTGDPRLTVDECGVTLVTFRHLYQLAKSMPGYEQEPEKWFADMCRQMSENQPSSKTQDPPLLLSNRMPGTGVKHIFLQVDWVLPVKVLKERFEGLVLKIQAAMPPSPKKKRHHIFPFQDWARDGLLPYLDLMIWEMETGAHIPDRVMAAAVRPHHYIGESNLQKTLIPRAKKLMADGGLTKLMELAASAATAHIPINLEN